MKELGVTVQDPSLCTWRMTTFPTLFDSQYQKTYFQDDEDEEEEEEEHGQLCSDEFFAEQMKELGVTVQEYNDEGNCDQQNSDEYSYRQFSCWEKDCDKQSFDAEDSDQLSFDEEDCNSVCQLSPRHFDGSLGAKVQIPPEEVIKDSVFQKWIAEKVQIQPEEWLRDSIFHNWVEEKALKSVPLDTKGTKVEVELESQEPKTKKGVVGEVKSPERKCVTCNGLKFVQTLCKLLLLIICLIAIMT